MLRTRRDNQKFGGRGLAAVDGSPTRDQVFDCRRCGQRVVFVGGWAPPNHSELASGVCSTCRMRERAAGLPAGDVAAIRAAASGGVLSAVKLARERLGWSLHEAVSLVHVLGADVEPATADVTEEVKPRHK